MNSDKNYGDLLIGILLGIGLGLYAIFSDPFLLWIIIPSILLWLIVWASGTRYRDEFFNAKKVLQATVLVIVVIAFSVYYFTDRDFVFFAYNQNYYIVLASLLVSASLFFQWFAKKAIPISSVKDDDRLVQETMYEDYKFQPLGDTYAYRYAKFVDEAGQKLNPKTVAKAKGKLTPRELKIDDIEMEAINFNDELKFYYEKLIYDMFNDFITGGKNQEKMQEMYGYSFTIVKGIKSQAHFKEVLKEHSLLYYKIFCFLEADMNKDFIGIKLRWQNLYKDNLYCLEFCLISVILMVRRYMNFPVGDLAKYVKSSKDKNFLGCFSSLPADMEKTESSSVNASGCVYYYAYYKIHIDSFLKDSVAIEERWLT
ncbi:MAG: hypothetical protein PHO62_07840 [Sulfurimonas sp.]|uniref:hypothetical protein n=1 Tax=Sulfurimonas sp. TaxID=2022749 RepID=UPI00261511F7|nr:hypothetical protein [Sulfurimonas sp.]MDD5373318.1 hypothetical protein [Sulfurimonas sp.]